MATRGYSVGPAGTLEQVREFVGVANSAAIVNITIDLAASVTGAAGVARTVSKAEALQAIEAAVEYIVRSNWPPA